MIQMALAMASLCQYAAKEELFGVKPHYPSEKEVSLVGYARFVQSNFMNSSLRERKLWQLRERMP